MDGHGTGTAPGGVPWRADRTMGYIGLAMWAGTAVKVWPMLPPWDNRQIVLGIAGMFALVVAWPTLSPRSYVRWRIPALSLLRLYLFALPFNMKTEVFDAIAPQVATGHLALVANLFHLFMSIRIALLTFTSLGWRVPFRLHMLLQATNIFLMAKFGLANFCRSKLLSSPQFVDISSGLHALMSFIAMIFVPSTAILVPEDPFTQRIAFVLFCWVIMGWLVPTLLLLPEAGAHRPRSQRQSGNRAALLLESWLRMLLPRKRGAGRGGRGASAPQAPGIQAVASTLLHWWAVLLVSWGICCSVAPLWADPSAAAAAAAAVATDGAAVAADAVAS